MQQHQYIFDHFAQNYSNKRKKTLANTPLISVYNGEVFYWKPLQFLNSKYVIPTCLDHFRKHNKNGNDNICAILPRGPRQVVVV